VSKESKEVNCWEQLEHRGCVVPCQRITQQVAEFTLKLEDWLLDPRRYRIAVIAVSNLALKCQQRVHTPQSQGF
jgi:hypothetical protein